MFRYPYFTDAFPQVETFQSQGTVTEVQTSNKRRFMQFSEAPLFVEDLWSFGSPSAGGGGARLSRLSLMGAG